MAISRLSFAVLIYAWIAGIRLPRRYGFTSSINARIHNSLKCAARSVHDVPPPPSRRQLTICAYFELCMISRALNVHWKLHTDGSDRCDRNSIPTTCCEIHLRSIRLAILFIGFADETNVKVRPAKVMLIKLLPRLQIRTFSSVILCARAALSA